MIFIFLVISVNPAEALNEVFTLFLTREIAVKYFGYEDFREPEDFSFIVNLGSLYETKLFVEKKVEELSPDYLNTVSILSESIDALCKSDRKLTAFFFRQLWQPFLPASDNTASLPALPEAGILKAAPASHASCSTPRAPLNSQLSTLTILPVARRLLRPCSPSIR